MIGLAALYQSSSQRYHSLNRIIFLCTPWLIFTLAILSIGNAINAFQEADLIGFTPIQLPIESSLLKSQASLEYSSAIGMFLICTGLLFGKQFIYSLQQLYSFAYARWQQLDATAS